MKYIKSVTTERLQQYLDDVHTAYVAVMANRGYTVSEGEVVGKRNGQDDTNAQHTISFDEIKTMEDGSGWLYCINADTYFADKFTAEELATLPVTGDMVGLIPVDELTGPEVEIPVIDEPEEEEGFNDFGEPAF